MQKLPVITDDLTIDELLNMLEGSIYALESSISFEQDEVLDAHRLEIRERIKKMVTR